MPLFLRIFNGNCDIISGEMLRLLAPAQALIAPGKLDEVDPVGYLRGAREVWIRTTSARQFPLATVVGEAHDVVSPPAGPE